MLGWLPPPPDDDDAEEDETLLSIALEKSKAAIAAAKADGETKPQLPKGSRRRSTGSVSGKRCVAACVCVGCSSSKQSLTCTVACCWW